MKAIIEFNLDDPEDAMAHLRCVKSLDMALVLWNLTHNLSLYLHEKVNEESMDAFREMLRRVMHEEGILIDELIN